MTRPKKSPKPQQEKKKAKPHGGADLGRPQLEAQGHIEIAQGVFIPHEPDNKVSQGVIGTRAQRIWAPDRLLRQRNSPIQQYHHDAASRYYDDYLIGELGARKGRGGSRLEPWGRIPYSLARAMRRESYINARDFIGPRFLSIVVWCVLQETPRDRADLAPTVEGWAAYVSEQARQDTGRWSTEKAVGFLIGALEMLAKHYGYAPR